MFIGIILVDKKSCQGYTDHKQNGNDLFQIEFMIHPWFEQYGGRNMKEYTNYYAHYPVEIDFNIANWAMPDLET